MPPLNEEDLRGLSENERNALLDAGADDEDVAREFGLSTTGTRDTAAPAGGTPEDQPGAKVDDDDDDEAAQAAAAAPAPAAAPTPAAPAPEAPAPADPPAPAAEDDDDQPPARSAPADIAEQRQALTAREDESMSKLMEGEITPEDHAKVRNEVRAKLDELMRAEASDAAVQAVEMRAMQGDYRRDLRATVKLGAEAGIDYSDGETGKQFDRAVKMFSENLSADGVFDRPGNLANSRQALAEAHAFMLRRAGKTAPAPAPSPAPAPAASTTAAPAAPAKPTKARDPVDRSTLAPTLANVPTAADATIATEFAHLEGLEHADLERALARMTPEQQDRYLGQ